jgi:hypothetical protein
VRTLLLGTVAVLALSALAPSALADAVSGRELYTNCKSIKPRCLAYLHAYDDTLVAMREIGHGIDRKDLISAADAFAPCSQSLTFEQLRGVYVRYAEKYPEILGSNAAIVLTAAITETFPCKRPSARID